MPTYGDELLMIIPPHNWRLDGSSSWINMMTGIDQENPEAWSAPTEQLALASFFYISDQEETA
jgi:hypothetical protein